MSQPVPPEKRQPKCAQCHKKPVSAEYRPFCSKRCADVDLAKWLNEGYAIPGSAPDDEEDSLSGEGGGEMSADD
ncbi:MAG: DNA gyrase inhibitor YacG [Hyphomonas sp.]